MLLIVSHVGWEHIQELAICCGFSQYPTEFWETWINTNTQLFTVIKFHPESLQSKTQCGFFEKELFSDFIFLLTIEQVVHECLHTCPLRATEINNFSVKRLHFQTPEQEAGFWHSDVKINFYISVKDIFLTRKKMIIIMSSTKSNSVL